MSQISRQSDASTSHDSAAFIAVNLAAYQHRFLDALVALGRPCTAVEIAASVESEHGARETLRKRAGEMLKAGLIREVGRRQCLVTGAMARTFVRAGWTCPDCSAHRSDEWLLGNSPAECSECERVRESTWERAAIAEFDGRLGRSDAESLALNELSFFTTQEAKK